MVATAGNCADVARRDGVVVERGADLGDAEIEAAVEIDVGFVAPDGRAELLARGDFAGMLEEAG